ncbi:unnamed protein product, partial [Rotaria magnacalcarata]
TGVADPSTGVADPSTGVTDQNTAVTGSSTVATDQNTGVTDPSTENLAVCSPQCSNGGTCTALNSCHCTSSWTGSRCETCTYTFIFL